jgi:hypothetical protein
MAFEAIMALVTPFVITVALVTGAGPGEAGHCLDAQQEDRDQGDADRDDSDDQGCRG